MAKGHITQSGSCFFMVVALLMNNHISSYLLLMRNTAFICYLVNMKIVSKYAS